MSRTERARQLIAGEDDPDPDPGGMMSRRRTRSEPPSSSATTLDLGPSQVHPDPHHPARLPETPDLTPQNNARGCDVEEFILELR